jgi:pimeloyl-ACP methyl ester carboxylesterase
MKDISYIGNEIKIILLKGLCRYLFFAALIAISGNTYAQNFKIGHTSVCATDGSRNGRVVDMLIYYPADSSGEDVPLASLKGKNFPVVSFGHGYMMPARYYQNIWTCIVPEGYIMVLPTSETGLFPSHYEFGLDLVFAVNYILAENNDSSSLFYKKLSGKSCLMGHSMGGGSAILGAEHCNGISSLAVLSPLDTRPSSAEAAKSVIIPALVITGTNDFITPPRKHALPIFNALASPEKKYISIIGGNHCYMAIKNRMCDFAERKKSRDIITREKQHDIINRYLLSWLDYTLKWNSDAGKKFDVMMETDSLIERR